MEALLYSTDKGVVQCELCNHFCRIKESERGICNVRENKNGKLYSLVYDKIAATQVDPIEKKPLYHFQPGSLSYSIATAGCNFRCRFCQNHNIAQMVHERGVIYGDKIPPETIVESAVKKNCSSISYTYTEPTIYFETALEVSKRAKDAALSNIFVSNGYMSEKAIDTISPYLDAANIDLKSFSDSFYKKYCSAKLNPVLLNLEKMKKEGIHLEITTLIIPGLNDDESELSRLTEFILNKLGSDTPWHVSRFHPTYKLNNISPTDPGFLVSLRKRAMEKGLKYVYTGNIRYDEGSETICSSCGKTVIRRDGFKVIFSDIKDGKCSCGENLHCIGI